MTTAILEEPLMMTRTPILPDNRPGTFPSGWRVRAVSLPATEFSGDFYIATEVDGALWFAVGDFAGHGLGAAIFGMMVREELDRAIDHCRYTCLVEMVRRIDAMMREELPSNRFASLVVGRADADGRVTMVNAGHCLPLVLRADGAFESVATGGPVVGIVPSPDWSSTVTEIRRGDRLLVYTDGLLEARDENEDEFGSDRIAAVARSADAESTIDSLVGEVDRFTRGRRHDDLTLFVLDRG